MHFCVGEDDINSLAWANDRMNCFMCCETISRQSNVSLSHHHTATLWRNIHPLIFYVVRGLWPLEKNVYHLLWIIEFVLSHEAVEAQTEYRRVMLIEGIVQSSMKVAAARSSVNEKKQKIER